ncbi:HD domain-containing phosphohydrolase [Thiovibrio frasassiensis]|uniref:Response regulator n=1 Tax=Thiovibrio frasassiensis TaxID=2984131 RepID=A0A9X4RLP8_9BACT|nr:HD domain-containing phosphohydrolase [Thiovibrio frasassiensis]MDG4475565.1 response regulator [Thiovibrio frasassiensis]
MAQAKILIADDDTLVREAVYKILTMFGHSVVPCASGEDALAALNGDFDLIILDINMPGLDGFETLKFINERNYGIPVIFLTGAGSMEYAVKAINLGAYDFIPKPIEDLDIFNIKVKRAIEKRMYVLQEKAYKENLETEVRNKTKELAEKNRLLEEYNENLEISALNTMLTLQTALEEKDMYTAGHTTRVNLYAMEIGRAMRLGQDDMTVLDRACKVHDIGKLVVDVNYIRKPGPLTDEEWLLMKKHPEVGANIIKPLTFMKEELFLVRHHHERMDGKGYPDGLGGDEINLLTKIITVADSYDAMTSKRSYKQNLELKAAITEMRRCAGSQFDPEVVRVFTEVLENQAKMSTN